MWFYYITGSLKNKKYLNAINIPSTEYNLFRLTETLLNNDTLKNIVEKLKLASASC